MSNLLKKEKGFTLIEIVLVLAIAGLLLVIVFLAVSGAQKSRRDSQRKDDIGRIYGAVENYASNTNGSYPANQAAFAAAIGTGGTYAVSNTNDPLSGNAYTYNGLVAPSGSTSSGISYTLGQDCAGATAGQRVFNVKIQLEQGVACRDNK